jgi:hypothetical protein
MWMYSGFLIATFGCRMVHKICDFPFKGRYQAISLRVSEVAQLEVGLSSAEVGLERRLEDRMADRRNHGGPRNHMYLKMGYPPVI